MFDKVLKNGKIFLNNDFVDLDLAINGCKIAAVGKNLTASTEIDVKGNWILPGAIDAHTHFSLPFANSISADDFYSGTKAGAIGGVTTIIDFLAQKNSEGIFESFARRLSEARDLCAIDYSFHACIGRFTEEVKSQIALMADKGLTSLKVFMAYGKVGLMQNDYNLIEIMKTCQANDIMLTVHAENGGLIDMLTDKANERGQLQIESLPSTRPIHTEIEAIRKIALFARETGCKTYIVHTSSGSGAQVIDEERRRKTPIVGETCPQYLYLDDSKLTSPNGHYFACCPPIRPKGEQVRLWQEIADGNIAVVATDHCPFTQKDKDSWNGSILELPMGLPGIETLPAFILNGAAQNKIPVGTAIRAITENPARLFGLYPEKGSLLPGTDADIMVFNPSQKWTVDAKKLNMATDYSPYEGMKCCGQNFMTILRGQVIYSMSDGWQGKKGGGLFLKRKKTDPAFF